MASAGPSADADRPVEQRDAVPALEIGRVGQHEIGVGDRLGEVGVRIDEMRDLVSAVGVLVGEHVDDARGVHRRIPRHVRHVHEQRIDRIRIAPPRVGDDHVHHAVNGERRLPGEGLVDADRRSVRLEQQILRPRGKAERRAAKRRVRRDTLLPAGFCAGGIACGNGALKRNPPGQSIAPSSACNRWMARHV